MCKNFTNCFAPSAKGLDGALSRGAMMLLLCLFTTVGTWAQSVSYIDADGQSQSCTSYTVISGSQTSYSAEGWNVFCDLLAGGQTYNVTLVGRTLYKDGAWNTLCLPFSLTEEQIAASSLADADIRTLSGTNFSEGTLTLAFTPKAPAEGTVTSITAGTPYIIKWAKADGYDQADPATRDIKNPEFTSVTISNTSADVETTYMDFKGTYDRTNIYTDKKTNLYLGADDTLYYPWAEGMSSFNINAFRAYFQLKNGLTAGDPALSRFMLNFGDGEASGISLTPDLSPKGKGSIYTIDGRKVNGQHAKKGLYIHNGRKVVVK